MIFLHSVSKTVEYLSSFPTHMVRGPAITAFVSVLVIPARPRPLSCPPSPMHMNLYTWVHANARPYQRSRIKDPRVHTRLFFVAMNYDDSNLCNRSIVFRIHCFYELWDNTVTQWHLGHLPLLYGRLMILRRSKMDVTTGHLTVKYIYFKRRNGSKLWEWIKQYQKQWSVSFPGWNTHMEWVHWSSSHLSMIRLIYIYYIYLRQF